MRLAFLAAVASVTLAGCSTSPYPLAPDTQQGPTSHVCYSNVVSTPEEVRAIGENQCRRYGYGVSGLADHRWAPGSCGVLTPSLAVFQCGSGFGYYGR